MVDNQKVIVRSNMGICSILGIVFVVLKLVGVVDWSWWWVTAPFWGPIALFILMTLMFILFINLFMDF